MSPRNRLTTYIATAQAAGYRIPETMSYRKLRDLATEARFPAELIGQVWYFDPADTDVIARALGLDRELAPAQRAA
jgi:hypothetical protein